MEVLALLGSKNRCLRRFLELTERFCILAGEDNLTNLSAFEEERDHILKAIDLFDRKISESATLLQNSELPTFVLQGIQNSMDERRQIVERIVELDAKILEAIERAKEKIKQDLGSASKSKETLSKFKSQWISDSGTELDQQA